MTRPHQEPWSQVVSMHKSFPSSSPSFPQETNVQQWTAPPEPCWEGFTGVRGLGAPEGPGPPAPSVPGGWKQLWGRGGGVRAWMWPRGPSSAGGSAGLPGGSPFQSRPGRSEMKCSVRGSRRTLWGPDLPHEVDICWVGGYAHESPSPKAPGSRGKEGRGRWCGCSSWGRGGLNLLLR